MFMLAITYYLGYGDHPEIDHPRVQLQALTGTFLMTPIFLLAVLQRFKHANMAREEDVRMWLAEYPCPKLKAKLDATE